MSYPRAAIAGVTVFAARHLPLARATSFESWSDLSGAPHLRAGFFVRKGPCARDHGAVGSRLLNNQHGCGATRQMDRLSLPWRHRLRMGAELAADEALAAAMAAAVCPRARRRRRRAYFVFDREGEGPTARRSARGDPPAAVRVLHQRFRLDGIWYGGDEVRPRRRGCADHLHHADLGHAAGM